MAASTDRPPRTQAEELMRYSKEYAAAFDLQVWKAQQQALFQSQLSQAKKKLESKIRQRVAREQETATQQLENTRRELEEATRHLEEAQAEHSRKTEMLDARELALEQQKSRLALRHEEQVGQLEDLCQRQRESFAVQLEALHAQLREKDRSIAILHDRLKTSEEGYERLRRRVARYSCGNAFLDPQHSSSGEGQEGGEEERESTSQSREVPAVRSPQPPRQTAALRQLQDDLRVANANTEAATRQVRACEAKVEELGREIQCLRSALKERDGLLSEASEAYKVLQQRFHAQELRYVEEKKEELARRERALEVRQVEAQLASAAPLYRYNSNTVGSCVGGGRLSLGPVGPTGVQWSEDGSRGEVVGAYARKCLSSAQPGCGTSLHPYDERAPRERNGAGSPLSSPVGGEGILDLIGGLKQEVAMKLREQERRQSAGNGVASASHHIAKRGDSGQRTGGQVPEGNALPFTIAETRTGSERADNDSAGQRKLNSTKLAPISDEAKATTTAPQQSFSSSSTSPSDSLLESTTEEKEADALLRHLNDESSVSSTHRRGGDSLSFKTRRSGSSLAAPTTRGAPPRSSLSPPSPLSRKEDAGGLSLYPLPQDFLTASASSGVAAGTVTGEMRQFVEQVRRNRRRLLETQVYSADHPVLEEMARKIQLYEGYLRDHDTEGGKGQGSE